MPTDYKQAGQIVDDELNERLVKPLLPGVTLHALMDCCHSGTVLDLPYRCKADMSGKFSWKVSWLFHILQTLRLRDEGWAVSGSPRLQFDIGKTCWRHAVLAL